VVPTHPRTPRRVDARGDGTDSAGPLVARTRRRRLRGGLSCDPQKQRQRAPRSLANDNVEDAAQTRGPASPLRAPARGILRHLHRSHPIYRASSVNDSGGWCLHRRPLSLRIGQPIASTPLLHPRRCSLPATFPSRRRRSSSRRRVARRHRGRDRRRRDAVRGHARDAPRGGHGARQPGFLHGHRHPIPSNSGDRGWDRRGGGCRNGCERHKAVTRVPCTRAFIISLSFLS